MMVRLMDDLGLNYRPEALQIPRDALIGTLMELKNYVRAANLWYSAIDHCELTPRWADTICRRLY